MNLLLIRAMSHWRKGHPCPLDLAAKLIGLGYDVEALEQRHRRT